MKGEKFELMDTERRDGRRNVKEEMEEGVGEFNGARREGELEVGTGEGETEESKR